MEKHLKNCFEYMINLRKSDKTKTKDIYYKKAYSNINEINLFLKNNSNDLNSIDYSQIKSLRIKTSRFRFCFKVGYLGNKAIFKDLDNEQTFSLRYDKYNQAISRGVRLPEWNYVDNKLVIVASVYEFDNGQDSQRDHILRIES
tara:strand:+ start:83 stop:514 length:432 start_codon:yes stop_codon:yes gene_type:complete